MTWAKKMKIEFYPEICCDLCNETIHNHMTCPACGDTYASTDAYGDLDPSYNTELQCEECKAMFKLINGEGWYNDWEWERC